MKDLVRFHDESYMGLFCNPFIIIISLSIIFTLLNLISPFYSVSLYCLGSWPFHSGLLVSVFLSLVFCLSPLVCVTPQIYFLLLTGVWLGSCISLDLPPLPDPQLAVSCIDFSTSLSGFIYPSFVGFLPILLFFFSNIWSFLNFCMDFHLSWAFLILFLGISFLLSFYYSLFRKFKEGKNFTHNADF